MPGNKGRLYYFATFWLPVFLWALVIFLFSELTATGTTDVYWQDFIVKKSAHVVVFGILSLLLYRAFLSHALDRQRSAIFAIIISILYGFTDEYHQSFTPGREPRLRDVGFDTIGAFLAIIIIWKLLPKAPKKLKIWADKLQIS